MAFAPPPFSSLPVAHPGVTENNGVSHMSNYMERLTTFHFWPHKTMSLIRFARAGFFYTGQGDRVKCFSCGGELDRWVQRGKPEIEHSRNFPSCQFMSGLAHSSRSTPLTSHQSMFPVLPSRANERSPDKFPPVADVPAGSGSTLLTTSTGTEERTVGTTIKQLERSRRDGPTSPPQQLPEQTGAIPRAASSSPSPGPAASTAGHSVLTVEMPIQMRALHPNYKSFEARLNTFNNWKSVYQSASDMARAGFFYVGEYIVQTVEETYT